MKKLLLLTLSLASFAGTAMADSLSTASSFEGFNANLSAGGIFETAITSESLQAPLIPPTAMHRYSTIAPSGSSSVHSNLAKNSLMGQASIGYGKVWQRFYVGVDAFVNVASYEINHAVVRGTASPPVFLQHPSSAGVPASSASVTQSNSIRMSPVQYGLDFLPGFVVTPATLIYGRVGVAEATMTLNSSFVDTYYGTSGSNPQKSSHVNGLRLGVGLAHHIVNHWNATIDYIFTTYGSVNNSAHVSTTRPGGSVFIYPNSFRARMYTNAVLAGVSYQF